MGQVRKVSTTGFQFPDELHSLIEPQVCRMFGEPQTVQHQHVESAQCLHCRRWDLAQVSSVREVVEPISNDGKTAMYDFERRDYEILAQTKTRLRMNNVWYDLRQPATEMRWLKDVTKNPVDVGPRTLICIHTKRTKSKVERSNIIEAKDVIGLIMGKKNSMELS